MPAELKHIKFYCEKHGEVDGLVIPFINSTVCPYCAAEKESEYGREERKNEEEYKQKFWASCGVAPEYFGKTLEDFEAPDEAHSLAKQAVQNLIETKKGKIVLLGTYGCGKTLLASIAVMALGGQISTMYRIATSIHSTYINGYTGPSEYEILQGLAKEPLLVIDELTRSFGTESDMKYIDYLVDYRCTHNLPFILIGNTKPKNMIQEFTKNGTRRKMATKGFEEFVSGATLSRLQDAVVIWLSGEDRRRAEMNPLSNTQLSLGL